jgi:hypothetical protein
MHSNGKVWTDDIKRELMNDIRNGASKASITSKYNNTLKAVNNTLYRHHTSFLQLRQEGIKKGLIK